MLETSPGDDAEERDDDGGRRADGQQRGHGASAASRPAPAAARRLPANSGPEGRRRTSKAVGHGGESGKRLNLFLSVFSTQGLRFNGVPVLWTIKKKTLRFFPEHTLKVSASKLG